MKSPRDNPILRKRLLPLAFPLSSRRIDQFTPIVMLIILVAALSLAEVIVHQLLLHFPQLPVLQSSLIDHAIVVCIVIPFLYYFSYHPLVRHIRMRQQAEEALLQAHQQLELRVQERTRQLIETNDSLMEEIETRERVEKELQALSHRLVEVQENERRLIAREIHDEISQALTYLIFALDQVRRKANAPAQVVENVEVLEKSVQNIMDNLHRLAVDLRPASLDLVGLVPALRQMADILSEKYGMDVRFQAKGFTKRLPSSTESALFRIIQEASENAVQHAHATEIKVVLENCNGSILAEVADNGIGFDPATVDQNHQVGIVAMRERARMLGGRMLIESKIGKGTRVLVEVPGGD